MTCKEILLAHKASMVGKKEGQNEYGDNHVAALSNRYNTASNDKTAMEQAVVKMILGLVEYADAHQRLYEDAIGNSGVMGDYWLDTLKAIRGMLNGETGRLSCGAIDTLLTDLAVNVGFTKEQTYL